MTTQTWDLWISDAASRGISFGRGVLEAADVVLVHSPPDSLRVEVRESDRQVAIGDNLKRTGDAPMARLSIRDRRVVREDAWPTDVDRGRLVILPGGEVGRLLEWWNADDRSEWRWSVEFYNHR